MANEDGRARAGLVLVVVGVVLLAVSAYNTYENVAIRGDPMLPAAAELVVPLVAELALIGCGLWVYRRPGLRPYQREILTWTGVSALGVVVVIGWQVFLQQFLTGFQPIYILPSVLAIAAAIGAAAGVYASLQAAQRAELDEMRNQFRTLFDNVPDPVVGVSDDDALTVELVNPAFEEVLGMPETRIVDTNLADHIVDRDTTSARFPRQTPTEEAWVAEDILVELNGRRRRLARLEAPFEEADAPAQTGYVLYVDVTDEQMRTERLRVLTRILRHNIRNKMTVINGMAGSLGDDIASAKRQEQLDRLTRASRELTELAEQARNIDELVTDAEERPVDLAETLRHVVDGLRDQYPEVTFSLGDLTPATVTATAALPAGIEAIVQNGAEHNENPEPRVEVGLDMVAGDYAEIRVTDNGPGLDEETHALVTGQQEPTQLSHLDGLGLWLARWAVADAGGSLEFDYDGGLTVKIRLPITDTADAGDKELLTQQVK